MANAPNPPNPIDIVTATNVFKYVGLFTNDIDPAAWARPSAYVSPNDASYEDQQVFAGTPDGDAMTQTVEMERAVFVTDDFVADQVVKGWFLYAAYDDCTIVLGYKLFPSPITLGPRTNNLYVDPTVSVQDLATIMPLNTA